MILRKTFLLLAFLFPHTHTVAGDIPRRTDSRGLDRQQDSLAAAVRSAIAGMTTPELEARKARRRLLQQHGYVSILSQTLRADGLLALIMYTRVSLQLEYSLPRNTLYVYVPVRQPAVRDSTGRRFHTFRSGPIAVPLNEDRSFPEDPWKP